MSYDYKPTIGYVVTGTLTLSAGSVALGIGFAWGSGVLRYQGKDYPISVQRLSVADVGLPVGGQRCVGAARVRHVVRAHHRGQFDPE